jgi:hypothetical protein
MRKDKNPVVNVACPCNFGGHHFPGFTIHDGVTITGTEPAGCGLSRTRLILDNTNVKPWGLFVEGISGADISNTPVENYLQITPIAV